MDKVAELVRQDPGFNVNMDLGYGCTLLHFACERDSRSAVIPLLLAHPDIDVNVKDKFGRTPFLLACYNGNTSCVREMMLKDYRVKPNERNNSGQTPLWWAAADGRLDVIKWWIASGREIDLGKPGDVDKTDAIGGAKKRGKTEVVTLLERFKENPEKTRHAMRVELGLLDELAAEMFAILVFVSDGLQPGSSTSQDDYHLNSRWCCASARWDQTRRSSQAGRARWPSGNWQGNSCDLPHAPHALPSLGTLTRPPSCCQFSPGFHRKEEKKERKKTSIVDLERRRKKPSPPSRLPPLPRSLLHFYFTIA